MKIIFRQLLSIFTDKCSWEISDKLLTSMGNVVEDRTGVMWIIIGGVFNYVRK